MKYWSIGEKIKLYGKLSEFLKAGVSISHALEHLSHRQDEEGARVAKKWLERLKQGQSLSEAMKQDVTPSEYIVISAAEQGYGLSSGFQEVVMLLQKKEQVMNPIWQSLMWMAAGVGALVIVGFISLIHVNADSLAFLHETMISGIWLNLLASVGMLGAIGVLVRQKQKWRGYVDRYMDRHIEKEMVLVILKNMMQSGVAIYDGLGHIESVSSPMVKLHLQKIRHNMKQENLKNVGACFRTGLFDHRLVNDLEDYSALSSFSDSLYKLSNRQFDQKALMFRKVNEVTKNIVLFGGLGLIVLALI